MKGIYSVTARAFAVLAIGIICCCSESQAHPPHATEADGTVMAIDLETKSLVFKPTHGKKPLVLHWNKDTEFIEDGKTGKIADLPPGTQAHVQYRTPFFHNPELQKVTWH